MGKTLLGKDQDIIRTRHIAYERDHTFTEESAAPEDYRMDTGSDTLISTTPSTAAVSPTTEPNPHGDDAKASRRRRLANRLLAAENRGAAAVSTDCHEANCHRC